MNSVVSNLKTLYYTTSSDEIVLINPNVIIDGDGISFIYKMISNHDCILYTSSYGSEFLGYVAEDYDILSKYIDKINHRFNTEFNTENLSISIKFRRNDMSLTDAIMKLTQAVYLYANIYSLKKW